MQVHARIYKFDYASPADRRKREKKDLQKAQRDIWLECLPVVQAMLDAKTMSSGKV